MADLTKITFSFLKKKEYRKLQLFLKNNWSRNHIFVKSKKVLFWQHVIKKNKLNFFSGVHKKKIIATLGVIDFSIHKNFKRIGIGIWCSNKKYNYIGGVLFKKLLDKFKNSIIIATGLSNKVLKHYKFFNFKIKKFNKYYICPNARDKQRISVYLKKTNPSAKNNIKIISFNNFFLKVKSLKKIYYFKKRFQKHPKYNHIIFKQHGSKTYFISRIVLINNFKFLRIVDYFGSFHCSNLGKDLSKFCIDKKIEHVEFLHYGDDKSKILKSGFNLLNEKKSTLPILTEPYRGLLESNIIIAFKNLNKIKIVKGDCDADRPNLL